VVEGNSSLQAVFKSSCFSSRSPVFEKFGFGELFAVGRVSAPVLLRRNSITVLDTIDDFGTHCGLENKFNGLAFLSRQLFP
jgi:hypothetical protein